MLTAGRCVASGPVSRKVGTCRFSHGNANSFSGQMPCPARRGLRAVAKALVLMKDDPAAAKDAVRLFLPALGRAFTDAYLDD